MGAICSSVAGVKELLAEFVTPKPVRKFFPVCPDASCAQGCCHTWHMIKKKNCTEAAFYFAFNQVLRHHGGRTVLLDGQ